MDEQITMRTQGTRTYFEADGVFAPAEFVFADIESTPVPNNPDTEGEGFGLYTKSDATTGNVSFHVPTGALLPDTPRTVNVVFHTLDDSTTVSATFDAT